MRIGFLEPHLGLFGGIRRILELSNRLVDRGHDVTIYLPDNVPLVCHWMTCRARLRHIGEGQHEPLDILVWNDDTQWSLATGFSAARHFAYFALHASWLYGKPGSYESVRTNTDLILANSHWTAEMVRAEVGRDAVVLPPGIDHGTFRPIDVAKRYPLLCAGDPRPWKGTAAIDEAARRLGLPLEKYHGKGLPQAEMAAEYSRAEIFVVGSHHEGFGQPGMEALACGVPLVTTDNGGCREYAIDGVTALVVPPDDVEAMTRAIERLRSDPVLAAGIATAGRELVRSQFDWDRSAVAVERAFHQAIAVPRTSRLRVVGHGPLRAPARAVLRRVAGAAARGSTVGAVGRRLWNVAVHVVPAMERRFGTSVRDAYRPGGGDAPDALPPTSGRRDREG